MQDNETTSLNYEGQQSEANIIDYENTTVLSASVVATQKSADCTITNTPIQVSVLLQNLQIFKVQK